MKREEEKTELERTCDRVLMAQDACNLSGLAHGFADMTAILWRHANELKHGTDWVNRHPISVLMTEKMFSLASGLISDLKNYSYYYEWIAHRSSKGLAGTKLDSWEYEPPK